MFLHQCARFRTGLSTVTTDALVILTYLAKHTSLRQLLGDNQARIAATGSDPPALPPLSLPTRASIPS
jgi:hypothetical protein